MKDREYYFDLLEHRITDFNPYWEKPLGKTELRSNTKSAVESLKGYFDFLKSMEKQLKNKGVSLDDYNNYPNVVKESIKGIIEIISDGRDLWTPTEWQGRTYDHHIQKNGHLGFENDPWSEVKWCYSFLEDLEEILNSEKSTNDFSKYTNGKWFLFDGYENGSASVRFRKINKNKNGVYTFDGDIVWWATVDSQFEGDGVIIQTELEDVKFGVLPYMDDDVLHDDIIRKLESCNEETFEELCSSVHKCFDNYYLDQLRT
jgi:hypothetical protein